MFHGPLLSVVIPAHNAARTLGRALESVFIQGYAPIEVIVVDDCSADDTSNVAKSHADQDVRVLRLERCGGAANARNQGIKASRGELIAFLDADDEWVATKLVKQVSLLLANPAMTFVSCSSNLIAPDGRDCGSLYPGRSPASGRQAWRALLAYTFVATPSVVAWREALESAGGFDPSLKVGEDQDMWIRLAVAGEVGYINETLVRVHDTPNSLSSGSFQDQLVYTLPMIRRHIEARKGDLTPREINSILGMRLGRLGRSALGRGLQREGLSLILHAILLGDRPIESAFLMIRAVIPTRWVKGLLRLRQQ